MSDQQRTALRTWVASGGDLALVDGALNLLFPNERPPDVRVVGRRRRLLPGPHPPVDVGVDFLAGVRERAHGDGQDAD